MGWMRLDAHLFRQGRRLRTIGALVAIAAVGLVDFLTGPKITLSLFYLIPVAAASWFGGAAIAVATSTFAAVVWLFAELASSRLDSEIFVYAWNCGTRFLFLLLVALLLARLRVMLEREREMSRADPLTGLMNVRAFREALVVELLRLQRYGQPFSLAFIDVDDFKQVNDTRGHGEGDELLKALAGVLRDSSRGTDVVARYGGDEFVVLYPVVDQAAARAIIDGLSSRAKAAMEQGNWPASLSIGIVTCERGDDVPSVDALLAYADRLMYDAKARGKGSARFATWGR